MLHPLPNSFTHSPVDVPVQVPPAAGIPAPFPSLQFYVPSLDDSRGVTGECTDRPGIREPV